ncbi:TetR family transcriptional regulator [Anoxybacillus sp. UARK-01]|uniref:TetR/AcrR family transcriptional regulator n=1 Tax=Anoxybacillus sp. UARK-01 TaxID=1895648 RepID=UPI0009BA2780|nr:TetR family transcriptional regulator C-terminal domain-containing protein [Anoxybacillus sp. UARK-01]OQM45944.1 TetR family transcriptional regulator [Anoxybacillus sp. UARK-01]
MPKIVDHEKQRKMIAEATWRVIMRDGLEKATVRNIAKETRISVGSLRHYFASQSELLAFSMQLVSERVKERMSALPVSGPPLEAVKRFLCELLPLTDETRKEMEVWLAFTQKALWDKELQPLSKQVYEELRSGIRLLLEALIRLGAVNPNVPIEMETERLYALIDGLAMHGIMQPHQLSSQEIEAVIDYHLRSIFYET